MSAKFLNKCLLFYRSGDNESNEFLKDLNKNEALKKQFILVDQADPKINLPTKILDIGQPLILFVNGAQSAITGKDAIFWIRNNCFSELGNGLEFMDIAAGDNLSSSVLDEKTAQLAGTSRYSVIGMDNEKIDTYENSGTVGPKKSDTDKRLEKLRSERNELDAIGRPPIHTTMNFNR